MKYLLALLFVFHLANATAQVAVGALGTSPLALVLANSYSKEIALYRAKEYVMHSLLAPADHPVLFEVDALAAANSGELTSLVYKCTEQQREGLVLAFFGSRWNSSGVSYQAYGFKALPKDKAIELLAQLEKTLAAVGPYLKIQAEVNNASFTYEDLSFLLYSPDGISPRLRVFWGEFDSEWNIAAFNKTGRRLAKKL